MSHTETKFVMRVEIPSLNGKSYDEAYKYFKEILGEANCVDEYDDVVEYFEYHVLKNKYVPVKECTRDSSKKWGVDLILSYESYYDDLIGKSDYSMKELTELSNKLAEKFDVDPETATILSYTWYNGVDEPVKFR